MFRKYNNVNVNVFNDDKDISAIDQYNGDGYDRIIDAALNFMCKEKKLKEEDFDFDLIITKKYKCILERYHFDPKENVDPNGCFIPIYFQNSRTKKK